MEMLSSLLRKKRDGSRTEIVRRRANWFDIGFPKSLRITVFADRCFGGCPIHQLSQMSQANWGPGLDPPRFWVVIDHWENSQIPHPRCIIFAKEIGSPVREDTSNQPPIRSSKPQVDDVYYHHCRKRPWKISTALPKSSQKLGVFFCLMCFVSGRKIWFKDLDLSKNCTETSENHKLCIVNIEKQ